MAPSRVPAHDSGLMCFATPSSWWTFTAYLLPIGATPNVAHFARSVALQQSQRELRVNRTNQILESSSPPSQAMPPAQAEALHDDEVMQPVMARVMPARLPHCPTPWARSIQALRTP